MRCINPAQLAKGSRNLKSVTLKTAEISSIQISTNDRTATPRDRRNLLCSKLIFRCEKSLNVKISNKKKSASENNTFHISYVENKKCSTEIVVSSVRLSVYLCDISQPV
jgi:hypothetical protein